MSELRVQLLRLHDPGRRPVSWMEIVQPHQFAAFATDLRRGTPCDPEGQPFAEPDAAVCAVFESVDAARDFCAHAVERAPWIRFDIFDAAGRANPPLLTVVHPARQGSLESHPGALLRRRTAAWLLIACSVPVLALAYWLRDGGHQIFAGFIAINMLLAGGRLLWLNLAIRETEQIRQARIAMASKPAPGRRP